MGDGRGERGCMEEMGDGCGALARTPHAGGRRDRGRASRPRRGGWEIAAGRCSAGKDSRGALAVQSSDSTQAAIFHARAGCGQRG